MKKTIYHGPSSKRSEGLFNEDDFPIFVETLLGVELVQLSGDSYRHASSYHIEPQGLTLGFYSDKFWGGEVEVALFGKSDTFSEIEKKLLEEDKRRRDDYAERMSVFFECIKYSSVRED